MDCKKYMSDFDVYLHKKNSFTDVLEKIEEKTKVPRTYLCLGGVVLIALYLIFGYGGQFLANFIGYIYPAYCSFKAIESTQKDDDTKWLTYWVVYAAFSLVESVADIFLAWIPMYALLKCMFLIFLMLPGNYNGSIKLYYSLIQPYFLKHEKTIDDYLHEGAGLAENVYKRGTEVIKKEGEELTQRVISDKLADAVSSESHDE